MIIRKIREQLRRGGSEEKSRLGEEPEIGSIDGPVLARYDFQRKGREHGREKSLFGEFFEITTVSRVR